VELIFMSDGGYLSPLLKVAIAASVCFTIAVGIEVVYFPNYPEPREAPVRCDEPNLVMWLEQKIDNLPQARYNGVKVDGFTVNPMEVRWSWAQCTYFFHLNTGSELKVLYEADRDSPAGRLDWHIEF
jgi:hypothetical protein